MKNRNIIQEVKTILSTASFELNLEITKFSFAPNSNQLFGDYSTNIALQGSKLMNKSPYETAKIFQKKLNESNELKSFFCKISAEVNGFINFWVSSSYLIEIINHLSETQFPFKDCYGDKNTYIIEFSSPNMVKPFTIGYLRSTIIGDSVSKIFTYCGKKVIRDNHLGDWGTQYGKLLSAISKWTTLSSIAQSDDPYQELLNLYLRYIKEEEKDPSLKKKASFFYQKMEGADPETIMKWELIREILTQGLFKIYERLDIAFDVISWESSQKDRAKTILDDLINSGVAFISDGAAIVNFGDKLPVLVLSKSDGTTLYGARELANDLERLETYGDELIIINEVGSDQSLYLQQIYTIEEKIGWFKQKQRIHLSHGMYKLEGIKMISENGNPLYMLKVLAYATNKIKEYFPLISEKDAHLIALGAIKFNDLRNPHLSSVTFKMETFADNSKGTGPYIQYTAIRALSATKNSQYGQLKTDPGVYKYSEPELLIVRHLEKFSFYLESCLINFSCNQVADFAAQLAILYNNYYSKTIDVSSEESFCLLSGLTSKMLIICLKLLGISIPDSM